MSSYTKLRNKMNEIVAVHALTLAQYEKTLQIEAHKIIPNKTKSAHEKRHKIKAMVRKCYEFEHLYA